MSENSRASISLQAGGRTTQFDFPYGPKQDFEVGNGMYTGDFTRTTETPIIWPMSEAKSMLYPITITITVERKTEDAIVVFIAVDSLDGEVVVDTGKRENSRLTNQRPARAL
jgi:hypothetical protein